MKWHVTMIACLDVDYREAAAYAAGLAFHDWSDPAPATEKVIPVVGVHAYQPGQMIGFQNQPRVEATPPNGMSIVFKASFAAASGAGVASSWQ